ncbi:hypothetical protein BZZ08_00895 [Streptomyces sp. MH60]|nr:hypothetical protein BZZ08_00895 [Streptomyces sp. MH60]
MPLPVARSLPAVWGNWLPGLGVTGVLGAVAAGVLPPVRTSPGRGVTGEFGPVAAGVLAPVRTSPGRGLTGAVGPGTAGDVPSGWT